jgi:hypothetical protein
MDDRRFDALARALATPHPRRRLLRTALAAVVGITAVGREGAVAKDVHGGCRSFCRASFPPGRKRNQCVKDARDGTGPCYECGPAATGPHRPICRGVCCAAGEVCSKGQCVCSPDPAEVTCQGQCGEVVNNCGQAVDCGSCGPQCAAPGNACAAHEECCGYSNCNNGVCCRPPALPCASDAECCFGGCINGFCRASPKPPAPECHRAEDCARGTYCFVGDCALGHGCPFEETEEPGLCCYSPSEGRICDGACVSRRSDPYNCHGCGNVCPDGTDCDDAGCCVPLGGACTTRSDCCDGPINRPCIDGVCSHTCAPSGAECADDGFHCCSSSCVDGRCGCGGLHAPCLGDADCCSGTCYQLFCA